MNRQQLSDVLRAASRVADDRPIVMGSQAILGSFDADELPDAATVSMEADVAFLQDADRVKADLVTGAIGEDSHFHQLRGYYAEGIHVETARLPRGWQQRLITQQVPAGANGPGVIASFLEPHDLAAAKLAAFREKDVQFVSELAKAHLLDPATVRDRLDDIDLNPTAYQRASSLLENLIETVTGGVQAPDRERRRPTLRPPDSTGVRPRTRDAQNPPQDRKGPGLG